MGRLQLALNVDDLDAATDFYSKLFGVAPHKERPGYANFAIDDPALKLVLIHKPGQGGTINHMGVEVFSTDEVEANNDRVTGAGLVVDHEETEVDCCYAVQNKFWVNDPDGIEWEYYTVLGEGVVGASGGTASAVAAPARAATSSEPGARENAAVAVAQQAPAASACSCC